MAETRDLRRGLKESERLIQHTAKVADQNSRQISGAFRGIGNQVLSTTASILGFGGAVSTAFRAIQLAASAETLQTTFKVLVGDTELAIKTLKDLEEFALSTPFEMPELIGASKQMIAFGEEAENIVPTMRMLGNVASGLNIPLRDLTYLFGTLKSQGRAFTMDIRQFAMRGIPIYLELAKVLGLVSKEAKKVPPDVRQMMDKMITEGAVNFDLVQQAFVNMTKEGGRFFNLMEERSKTVEGLFNEMRETIDISLRNIGQSLIEGLQLHKLIRQVTEVATAFSGWLKSLSAETKKAILLVMGLTAVFLGLTAVIAAAGIVWNLFTGGLPLIVGLITTAIGLTAVWADSVGGLEEAWRTIKKAVKNVWREIRPLAMAIKEVWPLILVGLGPIGLVIGAVIMLVKHWDEVKAAVSQFWNTAKPYIRAFRDLLVSSFRNVRDITVNVFNFLGTKLRWVNNEVQELLSLLTGGQTIDWKKVFIGLKEAVLIVEYGLNNLTLLFQFLATVGELFVVGLFEDLKYFFSRRIPHLLKYFQDNWKVMFEGAFNIGQAFMRNLVLMIADGIASLSDILSGKVKIGDILTKSFNQFTKEAAAAVKTIPKYEPIGDRELTNTENLLRAEAKDIRKSFQQGFRAFRAGREAEHVLEDVMPVFEEFILPVVGLFTGLGTMAGDEFSKNFGTSFNQGMNTMQDKAIRTMDAVLSQSAEALSRIEEYRDRQALMNMNRNVNVSQTLRSPSIPNKAEERTVSVLEQIHEELVKQSQEGFNPLKFPPFVPANIP